MLLMNSSVIVVLLSTLSMVELKQLIDYLII